MTFADELRKSRESAATAYQEFLRNYPKSGEDIHAFFEGDDDTSFYRGFIVQMLNEQRIIRSYKCGGKKGVYDTYSKITESGRTDVLMLFFVDKDFSDFLGEVLPNSPNIYVTDYYSIENYLVSRQMLLRVWEELFNFTKVTMDFGKIEAKFVHELNNFHLWSKYISVWAIYARRHQLSPVLNNVNLSRICRFDNDVHFSGKAEDEVHEYLEKVCSLSTGLSFKEDYPNLANEFLDRDPKVYTRGKFELWFFVRFINKLYEAIRGQLAQQESLKMNTQVTDENAVKILGPRAEMPESLRAFLVHNLKHASSR